MTTPVAEPVPIRGVIFDFHATLVDSRDTSDWIEDAWRHLERPGSAVNMLEAKEFHALGEYLHRIWEHAVGIDPDSDRDLSPERHRDVFGQTLALRFDDQELTAALYTTMPAQWIAFDDALPVLKELKARGQRIVLLSNIGLDIRPHLQQIGMTDLLDGLVLSYEVGVVKPESEIFQHALDLLDVPAAEALMVGDSWRADAGAAALGIRTLVLPRTLGPVHGLAAVLRLVG